MPGKYQDIGSYVLGVVQAPGDGFLVLSSDEMNSRNIPNSVFLSCTAGALKAIAPKKIYTKFLGFIDATKEVVAMGEYGRGVRVSAQGSTVDEALTSSGQDPENRGPLRGGTVIHGIAYVVGLHRQVYARQADATWRPLEDGLPPVLPGTVAGYEAIAGYSPDELYAAGWGGEMVTFDGTRWRSLASPTNQILVALASGGDGKVYACGRKGLVLRGRRDAWEIVDHGDTVDDLWSVAWFQGSVYFSSMRAIYRLQGDNLALVDVSPAAASTFYTLSASASALWSVGPKDVIQFDGHSWSKID